MPDALKPSIPDGRGGAPCLMPCSPPFLRKRRCSMPDALQRPILNCMDPSCLTAGRPSIPDGKEALHA
jgi:hypothetical protein